ncbi:MAG: glycoside hydrolase [Actinomycetota bacterium]|nr:glycoside hydrolase [Actinomycetota bacterium]
MTLSLATSMAGAGAQEGRQLTPTGAVQVTGNPDPVRNYSSPLIARNPKSGQLAIGSVDTRGNRECVVHLSNDDGRSWAPGGGLMTPPFTDCSIGAEWGSYFSVFYDRNGVLYVPFAANDPALKTAPRPVETEDERDFIPRHVFLARSGDGGRTFETSMVYRTAEGKPENYSKGVVGAVDPNDPDNVYVGWRQGAYSGTSQKLLNPVAVSRDGGRTFAPPVDISPPGGADHPSLAVDRDGVVHAATWSRSFGQPEPVPPRPILHMSSRDHGKTWTTKEIDPANDRSYRPPMIAAHPGSDDLYVVWAGSKEPRNSALKENDRTDIFLSASTDGGRTWGPRRVVNDDAGKGVNHQFPNVAVAPNGRVDVAWYDARLNIRPSGDPEAETPYTDVFYAFSTDRGQTFSPNVRISDRSADRAIGVWSNNVGSAGPVGLVSTDRMAYFAWQDSRNGNTLTQAEDVYMASLPLDSPAVEDDGSSAPAWLLVTGGVALGMGLAMGLVWALARQTRGPGVGRAIPARS